MPWESTLPTSSGAVWGAGRVAAASPKDSNATLAASTSIALGKGWPRSEQPEHPRGMGSLDGAVSREDDVGWVEVVGWSLQRPEVDQVKLY